MSRRRTLYLEPFNSGSHAQFTQTLTEGLDEDWVRGLLPGHHWKWRMRGSAVHFATACPALWEAPLDLVFASSYLPLAELIGLRAKALGGVPSVLYFHENQLTYPVREAFNGRRDNHFGFTQLTSALSATHSVFNSHHNRDGFLAAGRRLLGRLPDAVPPRWIDDIEARSSVISVPIAFEEPRSLCDTDEDRSLGPIILWNHRWEYDKNPTLFFETLEALRARDVPFRLIVCGQHFLRSPKVFETARERLSDRILHWGYSESRADYIALLERSHIAVSTSNHEFFGVSMLEATHHGARPLVPDRLSYRELFPDALRYPDDDAFSGALEELCHGWCDGTISLRADRRALTAPHDATRVLRSFEALFARVCSEDVA